MGFKVINRFKDTKDNDTYYEVGDTYPKTDLKPSKERIAELSKKHPKYKRVFIQEVKEVDSDNDGKAAELLTAADIKKMNKGPQEDLIKELGGDPNEAKNEDERIAMILELQESKKEPSPE